MKISIIIPTYQRAEILKLTLKGLMEQSLQKDQYEVIVVDDGSNDQGETKKVVNATGYTYIQQKNQKQGIARNNGLKHAKYDIILFIGDDMVPANEKLLEEHLKFHKNNPDEKYGVLGFTDWHPDLQKNYFMKWLTHGSCVLGKYGGHQFAYEKLGGGPNNKDSFDEPCGPHQKKANHNFFYTSNISLKKTLLKKDCFDPKFSAYGWEDIELGYRLEKKHGFKLLYNPHAIVLHHHIITEKSLEPRMKAIAKSAYIINEKYPELKITPSKKKILALKILSAPIVLKIFKILSRINKRWLNYYYYGLSKKHYLQGLHTHK